MEIAIDERWGITSDERQFYLAEKSTRKVRNKDSDEKEVYYRTKTSHKNISGVLQQYLLVRTRTDPDITEFKQVVDLVEELNQKIDGISAELGV